MNILAEKVEHPCYRANRVWFESDAICVLLSDAREISVPLDYYPTLLNASAKQKEDVELFGNGRALYFENMDFYLSINSLVLGLKEYQNNELSKAPKGRPEKRGEEYANDAQGLKAGK